ncbi:hypothetical protein [Streptomyces sp. NPDC004376]
MAPALTALRRAHNAALHRSNACPIGICTFDHTLIGSSYIQLPAIGCDLRNDL